MSKSRREKMKQDLLKRGKESYESRNDSGRFKSFFRDVEGVEFWKCVAGGHIVDFIPAVMGINNPRVVKGKAEEGDYTYVLDIYIHYNVGVNKDSYVCPARNYGQPCPICEHQNALRDEEDYDEDLVKSYEPARRAIYNIVCYDNNKEEEKGIQIWNAPHNSIEKELTGLAKDPRTGEQYAFSSPWDGKSFSFTREGKGPRDTKYIERKFIDRKDGQGSIYEISDGILDEARCLDELMVKCSYEELYEAHWGEPFEKGDRDKEEPVQETEQKKSKTRTRVSRTTPEEKTEPVEERETPKEEKSSGCPHGAIFGEDFEKKSECNDCKIWDNCATRADELEEEAKKTRDKKRAERGGKGRK